MLTTALIGGLLVAIAFFILLGKIGFRRIAKHHIGVDVLVSAVMSFLFLGTMSGMIIALTGGIIFSLGLWGVVLYLKRKEPAPVLTKKSRFFTWRNGYVQ